MMSGVFVIKASICSSMRSKASIEEAIFVATINIPLLWSAFTKSILTLLPFTHTELHVNPSVAFSSDSVVSLHMSPRGMSGFSLMSVNSADSLSEISIGGLSFSPSFLESYSRKFSQSIHLVFSGQS